MKGKLKAITDNTDKLWLYSVVILGFLMSTRVLPLLFSYTKQYEGIGIPDDSPNHISLLVLLGFIATLLSVFWFFDWLGRLMVWLSVRLEAPLLNHLSRVTWLLCLPYLYLLYRIA